MKHITFSPSAGGSLKYGLKQLKVKESVLVLSDTLNIGPVEAHWDGKRKEFMNKIWNSYPDPDMELSINCEWENEITDFWEQALDNRPKTIWWSSASAPDWCGLMMIIDQLDSTEHLSLIDVNKHYPNRKIISVAELSPEDLMTLKDKAEPLELSFIARLLEQWEVLKSQQDKPLRWLIPDRTFEAVGWDVLDKYLMAMLKGNEPILAARLIGNVLGMSFGNLQQVSDSVLWYRLQVLVEDNKVIITDDTKRLKRDSLIQRTC